MITFCAYLLTFILFGLLIFQLALILGSPLGHFAWGGQYKVLPQNLKIGSGISIIIYIIISLIFLSKAGLVGIFPSGGGLNVASWVFTVYFFTGIPLNAISKSKKERLTMTPIVTLLFILVLVISL